MSWKSSSDKPGWRGDSPAQSRGGPAGQKKSWTKKKDRQYDRALSRHRAKLFASSLLLLVLIGALVYYFIPQPIRTPCLICVATEYKCPIPPNAWAREDTDRLKGEIHESILKAKEFGKDVAKEELLRQLKNGLHQTNPGGPKDDLIIVYLSMHGIVDGDNMPCLLPSSATPANPDGWLPVSELLDCIKKEHPGKKKLLILDANRMDANWSLGLLYNGFAESLEQLVTQRDDPDLAVLNSASPGQIGWAASELGGSVFGYYVWRGLRGEADGANTNKPDKKVSLHELHAYLQAKVAGWTVAHRDDVQTPMLLPKDMEDYSLVHVGRISKPKSARKDSRDSRWAAVDALWRRHEHLLTTANPYRLNPLKWEEFQHELLRLEQLIQAGSAYGGDFYKTEKVLSELADELEKPATERDLAAYSLPLARQFHPWTPEAAKAADRALATTVEQGDSAAKKPAKDADSEKPEEATPGDDGPEETQQQPTADPASEDDVQYGYSAAAEAAQNWAIDQLSSRTELGRVVEFLDQEDGGPEFDKVQPHFMRMLNSHLDPQVFDLPSIKLALRVRRQAEESAAPEDLRAHHWIRSAVEHADGNRRRAEDNLFVGNEWNDATGETDEQENTYSAAQRDAAVVAAALKTRDEAWGKTPYLAEWFLARLQEADIKTDDSLRSQLKQLIGDNHELALAAELDPLRRNEKTLPDLSEKQKDVNEQLDNLLGAFEGEWGRLISILTKEDVSTQRRASKLRQLSVILSGPLVTGEDRNSLRKRYLEAAKGIPPQALADPKEYGSKNTSSDQLSRLKTWPKHPALMILRLPEEPSQKDLPARLAKGGQRIRQFLYGSQRHDDPMTEVYGQANDLLKQTNKKLTKADSPIETRTGCSQADQLVRRCAALLRCRQWPGPDPDPTRQLRNLDLHYLLVWHAKRTLEDFWGPRPDGDSDAKPFFQIAAKRYLGSASGLCPDSAYYRSGNDRLKGLSDVALQPFTPGSAELRPVSGSNGMDGQKLAVTLDQELPKELSKEKAVFYKLPKGKAAFFLNKASDSSSVALYLDESQDAVRRLPVPIQGKPEYSVEYSIRKSDQPNTENLNALVLYRGHLRKRLFSPSGGWVVEFKPPKYADTTIAVFGAAEKPKSVVFILDCSATMKGPRIQEAKNVLIGILDTLADFEKPPRVGVMAYGHSGVLTREKEGDKWVSDNPKIPVIADVQWLMTPRSFSNKNKDKVVSKLEKLEPKGLTPLYLAIDVAIQEYRQSGEKRHVVAITDGMNNLEPTLLTKEESAATIMIAGKRVSASRNLDDLEAVLEKEGNDVSLNVVGFRLPQKDEKQIQQFKNALHTQNQRFLLASSVKLLQDALEDFLGLRLYEVQSSSRQERPQKAYLGKRIPVEGAGSYRVQMVDFQPPVKEKVVSVEKGQNLKLYLSNDPRRLIFKRYNDEADRHRRRGDPAYARNSDSTDDPREFFVRVYNPNTPEGIRFDVSIENGIEEEFSPRPKEVWMEVAPQRSDRADTFPVHRFFDLRFLPGRPVPMLSYPDQNWPQKADIAKIDLWFKLQPTDPQVVSLKKLLEGKPLQIERIAGVTFKAAVKKIKVKPIKTPKDSNDPQHLIDACAVLITETHSTDVPLEYVKVEMDPPPDNTSRRFVSKPPTVYHEFQYFGDDLSKVKQYNVNLTSENDLKENAYRLESPFEVRVDLPRR